MPQNTNTYTIINKDPIKGISSMLKDMLTRWKQAKYINKITYRSLNCNDGLLPRVYGLPKVHKPDCPFRIIVSSLDSPLYNLATFLHKILIKNIPVNDSHSNNSFDLIQKLKDIQVDDDYILISLNVVSLFTNIPIDSDIESVSKKWQLLDKQCNIPKNTFVESIWFVLDSTFFKFDQKIYKQNFGTPMGSPLSPIKAELVIQDVEREFLGKLDFRLLFYFRYVDDILTAVPKTAIDSIVDKFNAHHPRLQFTLEIEGDRINFLETTIIKNNNKLIFDKLIFDIINLPFRHIFKFPFPAPSPDERHDYWVGR